jgi:hypothetical protein
MNLTDTRRVLVSAAKALQGIRYDHTHRDETWKNLETRPRALDCSTFVCRLAYEALAIAPGILTASAEWLLDHLVPVEQPLPGDIVGYYREANVVERLRSGRLAWHVMLAVGAGEVIGACDLASRVVVRPMVYEGGRTDRWRLIDDLIDPAVAFRRLELL